MALIFGIDAGIATLGWAVIETSEESGRIVACGTRTFNPPENPKDRQPTTSVRRAHRGQRRVIYRRALRMDQIRRLFRRSGLLESATPDALALCLNPWDLRAAALDRPLTGPELAAALGHIAIHRGFRSNARAKSGSNAAKEQSEMLKSIAAVQERMQQWRTVGEMFARDPEFAARKRNRGGSFTRSILRADQEAEVRKIFATQRRLGNPLATEALESDFTRIAFSQRNLKDSAHLVGPCPFLPSERRSPRHAPSFERFRLLSRLANLKIVDGLGQRALTPAEIDRVAHDFGSQKKLSWKWLGKTLNLENTARFDGTLPDQEVQDFVARKGNAAEGTYALRQALGETLWQAASQTPGLLDEAAAILSFRSELQSIEHGLRALALPPEAIENLVEAARNRAFESFSGTAHISAAAARALLPHLAQGLKYSDACTACGFNHAEQQAISLEDVRNPIARKAAFEVMKQVNVMVQTYGLPEAMHVEMARDLGKSAEERDEISKGIEKRNIQGDRLAREFAQEAGHEPTRDQMLRYELWKEQQGFCLYSNRQIPFAALTASDNRLQIDHILPWSRFGDDSFVNKTLCFTAANAEKRGRTPFEWFAADRSEQDWLQFTALVEACTGMKRYKKRGHYLRRNATEVEKDFRTRNLNDTRYATRLVLGLLRQRYYKDKETRHVLARPGALTDRLRRGWGVQGLKKDAAGERIPDDRHHALDAIIAAACTESTLNRLTRAFQEAENKGLARDFSRLDPPWPSFREEAIVAFERVFVSRAELRRRARGELHAATIKQVREENGEPVVYERKPIEKLTLKDLALVKDADRNAGIIEPLRAWIEAGKPKTSPPKSHKGDPIIKVRLRTTDKPAVSIRGGTADRGDMARVDVFSKPDKKGRPRFYLVPIYPHQIASMASPPIRAVNAHKEESDWEPVDSTFTFLFSFYPNSLVEATRADGPPVVGYFKGMDRSSGNIALAVHLNPADMTRGIGTRTLIALRKLNVDRLGNVTEIARETRTWRGAVCT